MENIQQTTEVGGATAPAVQPTPAVAQPVPATPVANSTTQQTAAGQETKTTEMTNEQKELYNQTLRNISKTAHSQLKERYNAFEDKEIKAKVKEDILAGKTPVASTYASSIVARAVPKAKQSVKSVTTPVADDTTAKELFELKAELALTRAGINSERIDAAKKLFVAEGGQLDKVGDFVAKYPEWTQTSGVVFTKGQPLGMKTAPTPSNRPVLNDFERKVAAARKARGLE